MAYRNGKDVRTSFYKNAWVVFFIVACSVVYCRAVGKKQETLSSLDHSLETLSKKKVALLEKQEDLTLQINSQSDPAWIQLTLMKVLGLVPEGQLKVYFHSEKEQDSK